MMLYCNAQGKYFDMLEEQYTSIETHPYGHHTQWGSEREIKSCCSLSEKGLIFFFFPMFLFPITGF